MIKTIPKTGKDGKVYQSVVAINLVDPAEVPSPSQKSSKLKKKSKYKFLKKLIHFLFIILLWDRICAISFSNVM